jgi:hypothetical protein
MLKSPTGKRRTRATRCADARRRPTARKGRSGGSRRIAVASIDDLEAQGAQHASGAVYTSAEAVGTEWASSRVAVRDAENGLES